MPIKGFTLPEMLMALALLGVVASLSALAGIDSYQRALAVNDVERIAGMLRRSRSLAQADVCRVPPCDAPKAQGVRVSSGEMLLFEGEEFSESSVSESFELSNALTIESQDILFLPRSGRSLRDETVHVTDTYGRNRYITVTEPGVIAVTPI